MKYSYFMHVQIAPSIQPWKNYQRLGVGGLSIL